MIKNNKKFQYSDKNTWKFFVLPALILMLIVGIIPMLYALYISTFQYNMAKTQIPFKFVGLKNYITILIDPKFWNSFKLTLVFVIVGVSIELIIGTLLALILFRNIKGTNVFRSLLIIPMIISPIAFGLLGRYIFDDSIGIVNFILRFLHLHSIVWFGSEKWVLGTMILLDIWEWSPFIFILVLAGLMAIPDEYYEAAKIEGANYFGELFKITLPTIKNSIMIAIMIRIIDSFKEFDKVYMISRGGPNRASELLTIQNYIIAFKEYFIGKGSAFSIIILILMIMLGTILVKNIRRTYS